MYSDIFSVHIVYIHVHTVRALYFLCENTQTQLLAGQTKKEARREGQTTKKTACNGRNGSSILNFCEFYYQ